MRAHLEKFDGPCKVETLRSERRFLAPPSIPRTRPSLVCGADPTKSLRLGLPFEVAAPCRSSSIGPAHDLASFIDRDAIMASSTVLPSAARYWATPARVFLHRGPPTHA